MYHTTECRQTRGERLLQTHIMIVKEAQLPGSDWTRAIELYLLSNLSMRL